MGFGQLLKLIEQHPGRFIPLSNHKFLALSKHLQKQLPSLQALSENTPEGIKLHQYGSLALKNLVENLDIANLEVDTKWQQRCKTLNQVDTYQPQIPKTLQAELRPYQQEGFYWIAKLSQWSTGACLADDMGLGKTIQALAVLLAKADKGPCFRCSDFRVS